ncbi:Coiled-coil alpha-helical rod protein 1 [Frankliniella fusca]|uniref:Coiled-coil alpha-helical rod protein 1 n=1 Tax=Frankliniella fusca TaxID=407009 RepID=A0AAE1L6G0_9NEOP|nr:Coiled-coil alpha-helical rod protein 1 [Frankliniella fusca]
MNDSHHSRLFSFRKMKVARIQSSLKDLNKDIGNCERQMSRVLRANDSNLDMSRPQNATRNVKRQSGSSHLSRSLSKQISENQKLRGSRSSSKGNERNVICKEVLNKNATVEVVVRTKSPKKRSRSAQARQTNNEIRSRDNASRNKNPIMKSSSILNTHKNASWGHILQHQSSSACHHNRKKLTHNKGGMTLHYSSSEEGQSSEESDHWASSIPNSKEKSNHKAPHQFEKGIEKKENMSDNCFSSFNPLRTLNFLVKELRGKVHKNCDENMQRIVEDMEKALCTMSSDMCLASPCAEPTNKTLKPSSRNTSVEPDEVKLVSIKDKNKSNRPSLNLLDNEGSPNLVDRLLTTVSRINKITGYHESPSAHPSIRRDSASKPSTKSPPVKQPNSVNFAAESVQTQLEQGCKQLEETCRQMEETCKSLGLQKTQLLEDLRTKTQQLETALGKNQQLTIYAADLRQEMSRIQQTADLSLQEHETLKQKLLSQQRELQDSNNHLKKRLEETLIENQHMKTELQLCQLNKDKMHILMSNKDLEIAKLKKEIVDINTLVAEQLSNIRSLSQKKGSRNDFGELLQAVSQLHDTIDSVNSTLEPHLTREGLKNHMGEGEGSRSRPICSSPTSSINSSLYTSWHLMSDITAENEPKLREHDRGFAILPKDTSVKELLEIDKQSSAPTEKIKETTEKDGTSHKMSIEKSAKELKAGLHDMFDQLKKQTSEAVNITLPSPPRTYSQGQETLGLSQWTELSASESTVLFHSSEESDLDEML